MNFKIDIDEANINGNYLSVKFNDGTISKYEIEKLSSEFTGVDNELNSIKKIHWDCNLKSFKNFKYDDNFIDSKEMYEMLTTFYKYGFIIIPISTSVSSWFNAFVLYIYLINKKHFIFLKDFYLFLIKLFFSCTVMGVVFKNLLNIFSNNLVYSSNTKLFYMIIIVLITFVVYLFVSIITKAFKISDINLKY